MLSRRYRLVATVVTATLVLLFLVNYDLSRPWGYNPSDAEPIVVHKEDYDYDSKANQFETLVVDTRPLYTQPASPLEKPDSAPKPKPKPDSQTPAADKTEPTPVVQDLTPSEITAGVIPDQTVEPAVSPAEEVSKTPNYNDDLPYAVEVVDWTRFAYTQYVTDSDYLCNSVMIFETLHRLGSQADRVMMYPSYMLPDPAAVDWEAANGKLLVKARDSYGVKLVPIQVQHRDTNLDDNTWNDSYTKLLAFNQTSYDRVLALDSDSVVLQSMDELFLMPSCPVAMPRAYWLLNDDPPRRVLSSQIMLLQPDVTEFERIQEKTNLAGNNEYDMEIVNELYLDSATILPHRKYDLLTAEFRDDKHALYLGSDREEWDPVAAFKEAKFMHFSDWPVPKPWIPMDDTVRTDMQPNCKKTKDGQDDCQAREMWNGFYKDFLERRKTVCGLSPRLMNAEKRAYQAD